MEYKNTTDIDNVIIISALRFIRETSGIRFPKELTVRNKSEAKGGVWGYYQPVRDKICIVLPRKFRGETVNFKTYSKLSVQYRDRTELVITTLAHEMRHLEQNEKDANTFAMYFQERAIRHWLEVDAEKFSVEILRKWREFLGEDRKAACETQGE